MLARDKRHCRLDCVVVQIKSMSSYSMMPAPVPPPPYKFTKTYKRPALFLNIKEETIRRREGDV